MLIKLPPGDANSMSMVKLSSAAVIHGSSVDFASYPYIEDIGIEIASLKSFPHTVGQFYGTRGSAD